MKHPLVTIICIFLISTFQAFSQKKSVDAIKINESIKIDGVLNESAYTKTEPAKDFVQLQPYNGKPSYQPTEVYFLYDETAIYVGAVMYDNQPDSIYNYLTERDNIGMSDYFGVYFDPFNAGQLAFGFFITPAGIQVDIKATHNEGDNEDGNWNEVWESKTRIEKFGWVAEMRIPFSALRFPEGHTPAWGLNMFRNIRRYNSNNSWSLIDKKLMGFIHQEGELKGINDVKPPLRLSLTPYMATHYEKNSTENSGQFLYKGGLDLKYGINESFTLDMMLIPDFGQIQSDDKKLNLSPFELYYDEKRQFFTEGTELFNRGNIFYSRRIGASPKFSVDNSLQDNEITEYNPGETQLVNATKISGRTNKGWGLGVLNAMSLPAIASVKDTLSNTSRNIVVQPFTNYNVAVIDKSLPNNSFISIINTNLTMFGNPYSANVTATDFQFRDKTKTYMLKGKGAISSRGAEEKVNGYFTTLGVEKNKGKIFWGATEYIYSDKYNPNDLGYLQRNNQVTSEAWIYSQTVEPVWIFREINGDIWYQYNRMYKPNTFFDHEIGYEFNSLFKNNYRLSSNGKLISKKYDYYEPRTEERFFISPYTIDYEVALITDQRKNLNLFAEFHQVLQPEFKTVGNSLETGLNWRIGHQFEVELENENSLIKNEYGFAGFSSTNDSIIFSKRNVHTLVNTFTSSYIINNSTSLGLRARHYWSGVENLSYYNLKTDGNLSTINNATYNFNQNYNALTLDILLRWIFAPGSEISVSWKTFAYLSDNQIENNYLTNFANSWKNTYNSLSVKVLYYLDCNKLIKGNLIKKSDKQVLSDLFQRNRNSKFLL